MSESGPVELEPRQKRFVEEYLVDLNATQAAIRAGYNKTTARAIGCENLTKPNIASAIQLAMAERAKRTEITQDQVLRELAKIGFANILDYVRITADGAPFVDMSAIDRDKGAAIQEVNVEEVKERDGDDTVNVRKVKFKLHDKKGALVDIGKHLGMFVNLNMNLDPLESMSDEQLRARLEHVRRLNRAGADAKPPTTH